MTQDLLESIDRAAGRRAIVIGEAMLDTYLDGSVRRVCREAPAPIVTLDRRTDAPGGAANTAVNVRALGGESIFLSVVGDDPEGATVRHAVEDLGVAAEHIIVRGDRRTIAKNRILADGHMLVRYDQGTTDPIDRAAEDILIGRLEALAPSCEAIIVSDYRYGIVTPRILEALGRLQASAPRTLVVDSKVLGAYRGIGVTAVKPNYDEAMRILGLDEAAPGVSRVERIARHGADLLEIAGAQIAAVTIDRDGCLIFERGGRSHRVHARPIRQCYAAGAGDTFVAAFSLGLAAGRGARAAGELAAAAAAVVVGKNGTALCSHRELRDFIGAKGKVLRTIDELTELGTFYRAQGMRVVFTNGCFDLIHRGHIAYLEQARTLGDVLIVGVNTDESVRGLKGPARPINSLEDRLKVLAGLAAVDHLVPFGERTPENLIRALGPDVFVKGGDYTREFLPEAAAVEELGGTVEILPYLENCSTTGILDRVRKVEVSPDGDGAGARRGAASTILPAAPRFRPPAAPPFDVAAAAADWKAAGRILCVRLDNIGDVLMTTPAIRALKESRPDRKISLLASPAGAEIARYVPEIDEVIAYEAPWMKAASPRGRSAADQALADRLRRRSFDGAVVFTVYSQNPMPAVFLCFLADIPLRLAHCRENPYHLLTHWMPETEPESGVRHEVRRQLDLVAAVGCRTAEERLSVRVPEAARKRALRVLDRLGIERERPWAIVHPGASAPSRRYPPPGFAEAARRLALELGWQILFTGADGERELVQGIQAAMGVPSAAAIGLVDLGALIALISLAPIIIANNTGPAHIAAAVGTPVVDLYALTNPQHAPWGVACRVLSHDVPCRYCYKSVCPEGHGDCLRLVSPDEVVRAAQDLYEETRKLAPWTASTVLIDR